jgi:hypothetical protein
VSNAFIFTTGGSIQKARTKWDFGSALLIVTGMEFRMPQFRQLERLRYFTGQLLTTDDLQQEQDYFRGKFRLHNRFSHGWGIVAGLNVTVDQGTTLLVSPGFALDCAGNELVLPEPERIPLPALAARCYVTIQYLEAPVGRTPSLDGEPGFSRVREAVGLEVASANPGAGHSGKGPGSSGCGQSHALCLATVSHHGTHWRVDPAKRSVLHRK